MRIHAVLEGDMPIKNSHISPFLARELSCAGDGLFAFWEFFQK